MNNDNNYYENLLSNLHCDIEINKAEGSYLFDTNGQQYLDCLAQYGVVPLGHNPPKLISAVKSFFDNKSPVFVQPFKTNFKNMLSEILLNNVPDAYQRVRYCNSGTESVELALKAAKIKTGRYKILSLEESFHGKTSASLLASGSTRYKSYTDPSQQYFCHENIQNIDNLKAEIATREYAAFIFEPVIGEGGMHVIDPLVLKAIEQECKKSGTLLIADEVQTGLGRCGAITLTQTMNITPDLICLSKALSGGISPIGAVLMTNKAYSVEFDKKHSSTFANNGLSCYCSYITIKLLLDNNAAIMNNVKEKSKKIDGLCAQLKNKYGVLVNFSGTGFMRGIHFHLADENVNYIIEYLKNNGLLAYVIAGYLLNNEKIISMPLLSQTCSLRFEPSLIITSEEIDRYFTSLDKVLEIIHSRQFDKLFSYIVNKDPNTLPNKTYEPDNALAPALEQTENVNTFAFLIHTTSTKDITGLLPNCILDNYTIDEQNQLIERMLDIGKTNYSPEVCLQFSINTGQAKTNGIMIFCPLSPSQMMRLKPKDKKKLMHEYINIANEHNATVIGLGAYTSIITRGGLELIPETKATITTGNSLTAMASIAKVVNNVTNTLDKKVAIIGPRGSIGRLCVLFLSDKFSQVFLVGRKGTHKKVYADLFHDLLDYAETCFNLSTSSALYHLKSTYEQSNMAKDAFVQSIINAPSDFSFVISDDPEEVIQEMDCILSATSHGKPFLNSETLKPHCVVVDSARPFDFIPSDSSSIILEGGLVNQPVKYTYGDSNMLRHNAGITIGCFSETIALSLEGVNKNYSLGNRITPAEALEVEKIAIKQGFTL